LDEQQNDVALGEIYGEKLKGRPRAVVWLNEEAYTFPKIFDSKHLEIWLQLGGRASLDELSRCAYNKNIVFSFVHTGKFEHGNRGISHILSS
jgi:hypothetical protein